MANGKCPAYGCEGPFVAWKEDHSDEKHGRRYTDGDHESAAKAYAEDDSDGLCEGMYEAREDAVVCVKCPHRTARVGVFVEYEPYAYCDEIDDAAPVPVAGGESGKEGDK